MKGSIVAALPKQHSALAELTESFVFNELHNNHTASYKDVVDCIMDHLCGTQLCLAMVHRNEPDLNSTMELLSDCVGTLIMQLYPDKYLSTANASAAPAGIVDLVPLLLKQGIEVSAVNFNSPRVENYDTPFVDDTLLSQQCKADQYRSMYASTCALLAKDAEPLSIAADANLLEICVHSFSPMLLKWHAPVVQALTMLCKLRTTTAVSSDSRAVRCVEGVLQSIRSMQFSDQQNQASVTHCLVQHASVAIDLIRQDFQ